MRKLTVFEPCDKALPTVSTYKGRLETFKTWLTLQNIPMKVEDLAKAVFFYTGVVDKCRCHSCMFIAFNWEEWDDPYLFHDYGCKYYNKGV